MTKAKNKNVSGNPPDTTFLGPTLNVFGTSENCSIYAPPPTSKKLIGYIGLGCPCVRPSVQESCMLGF